MPEYPFFDVEDLPGKVGTDSRYEKTIHRPFGLPPVICRNLLACCFLQSRVQPVHFLDDHTENLKNFEQTARNMHSLSRYSRANQVNKQWIEEYLNEAHSKGLISVRCHCNVMAWSDD